MTGFDVLAQVVQAKAERQRINESVRMMRVAARMARGTLGVKGGCLAACLPDLAGLQITNNRVRKTTTLCEITYPCEPKSIA